MLDTPPDGFDTAFFAWLEQAEEELLVAFVSEGGWDEQTVAQLERSLGVVLPEDIRRFYSRCSVWGALHDWTGWDLVQARVRQLSDVDAPLVPIDLGCYGSGGQDVVAAVESPTRYRVLARDLSTGEVREFHSLRAYFVQEVQNELAKHSKSTSGLD